MTNEEQKLSLEELLKPCTKFSGAGITEQMEKIAEEYLEVDEASGAYIAKPTPLGKKHLAMEIADVIVSCVTYLHNLGYDLGGRKDIYAEVFKKNDVRNYYKNYKRGE